MLKLNASFNKKVPAETEFSSKGYSASIELEIPDGLTQEQLREKIHTTFEMVRQSVETEINSNAQNSNARQHHQQQLKHPSSLSTQKQATRQQINDPASPRQVKYLTDLARKLNISLVGYLQKCGCNDVSQLSRQNCSALIKSISNYAAA